MTPEQRAQEYALNNCPACNERGYEGQCDCKILAAAYLAGLSDRDGMKWVKASERLPDENQYVLIHGKGGRRVAALFKQGKFLGYDLFSQELEECEEVLDWRLLPEIPGDESPSTPPGNELLEALEDLVFTASKLWDDAKPIKDNGLFKVTHPIIEAARAAIAKHKP